MRLKRFAATAGSIALASTTMGLQGGNLVVPNASFESPVTSFVSVFHDAWQESPKPDWYQEDGEFLWTQLTGLFQNPAPGRTDRIDNCDGDQSLWLFAVPEVAVFQDYDSVDWNDSTPTHAFNATFLTGHSYELTVGVIGGGGGMLPGATLELSLYYLDPSGHRQTVAVTTTVHSPEAFPSTTHFVDQSVRVPVVKADDPWAGRHLGIRLASTVGFDLQGGYWDIDNIRLSETAPPVLLTPVADENRVTITIQGEPGQAFEVLATAEIRQPMSAWTTLGTVTNLAGTVTFTDATNHRSGRFYRVREVE